jgi:hypothetical protein
LSRGLTPGSVPSNSAKAFSGLLKIKGKLNKQRHA